MNQNKKKKTNQKLKVTKLVNSVSNYKQRRKKYICFEVGFKCIDNVYKFKK